MITIEQKLYDKMPSDLKALFIKLPNPTSEEVLKGFPNTTSGKAELGTGTIERQHNGIYNSGKGGLITSCFADSGSASRFFYCAKADKSERNIGLGSTEQKFDSSRPWCTEESDRNRIATRLVSKQGKNNHPIVKPIDLMQYLCRMITPPNGLIYDPFLGSGSTAIGAKLEGFNYIGSEIEIDYFEIAEKRISIYHYQQKLF